MDKQDLHFVPGSEQEIVMCMQRYLCFADPSALEINKLAEIFKRRNEKGEDASKVYIDVSNTILELSAEICKLRYFIQMHLLNLTLTGVVRGIFPPEFSEVTQPEAKDLQELPDFSALLRECTQANTINELMRNILRLRDAAINAHSTVLDWLRILEEEHEASFSGEPLKTEE